MASSEASPGDPRNNDAEFPSVNTTAEVFISYSSRDRDNVLSIRDLLEVAGVSTWLDSTFIDGGDNYGPAIVDGIRNCLVFLLCCSASSMRSRNVRQEITLAWDLDRPILPLLIDDTVLKTSGFPDQVRYWLTGHQWIEALPPTSDHWFPQLLRSLDRAKVGGLKNQQWPATTPFVEPVLHPHGLDGLFQSAGFTDQVWPVRREDVDGIRGTATRGSLAGTCRDIGAPQVGADRQFRIGEHLHVVIEHCGEKEMYLTLLERGTSGRVYAICPSRFVPDGRLAPGRHVLPAPASPHPTFIASGPPGTEELLAVLTPAPLDLDWKPRGPEPARVLSPAEIDAFSRRVLAIPVNERQAFATYFEIVSRGDSDA